MTQPIHLREPRIPLTLEVSKDEETVTIRFLKPFIYGDNAPYSSGKAIASQLLRKHYNRIRVVDMKFDPTIERVVSLTFAHR